MQIQKFQVLILILGVFLISFVSAGNLSLFPNPGEASVNIAYIFNFSSTNDCDPSNIILSHSEIVTTNSRGFGYVSIDISGLSSVPLRLCEYKDSVLRANHSFSDIIFNTIYARNLNLSGDARIGGDINITGNATVNYIFGNGSQLTDVCLENGSNCPAGFADTQKGTSGVYLYNDSNTIYFNESQLNATIDDRATGLGDNASWNQSLADERYVDIGGDNMTGNLNITGNITTSTGFFSWLGSLASRITKLFVQDIDFNGTINGSGNIIVTENISANLFKGEFNWTSADNWNIFNGSVLYFNESKLETIYYNATQSSLVTGIIDGGALTDTQHQDGRYDGKTFNFSEEVGSPALDLRINFTGVDSFNQGVIRYKTSNLFGTYPIIQMWNYDLLDWEDYPSISESLTFATITQPVFDAVDHVSVGVVQMRIYKASNGNTNNHYYVDWLAVSKGYGTPSGEEIDPHSIHRDGSSTLTGDWDVGAFNITNVNYLQTTTLNMTLTYIGKLIMGGVITSQNITPITTNLYSLGNSSNWFQNLFVRVIKSTNISATNLNATNIQSTNINTSNLNATDIQSSDIGSDRINTTNLTVGGYDITEEGGDLVISLT